MVEVVDTLVVLEEVLQEKMEMEFLQLQVQCLLELLKVVLKVLEVLMVRFLQQKFQHRLYMVQEHKEKALMV